LIETKLYRATEGRAMSINMNELALKGAVTELIAAINQMECSVRSINLGLSDDYLKVYKEFEEVARALKAVKEVRSL
jgi:hypothetical protein